RISGMSIHRGSSYIQTLGQTEPGTANSQRRNFGGNIQGTFTGDDAEALLLDFNFSEMRDASNYVTGFSLFEQVPAESPVIDWGAWDMPVLDNWHQSLVAPTVAHLEDQWQTPEVVLWILKNLGRSYAYEPSGGFGQGFGAAAGELSDVQASFNIGFGTGDLSNGQLVVTDANLQDWAVAFDGTLAGGDVTLSPLAGSFTIDQVANNGQVTLGGAFTDLLATGFTGAFEFIDGNDASNYLQGL